MTSVNEQSMEFNRRIKVNFDGGNLTTDAGLLLYKEFDEKIGLSNLVKTMVKLNDPVHHDQHYNDEVIMQKIYQQNRRAYQPIRSIYSFQTKQPLCVPKGIFNHTQKDSTASSLWVTLKTGNL